jgi:hypothetical protein
MSEPEVFVIKATGKGFASNESHQMVNLLRRLDVNEQTPDPTSDAGSIDTELSALTALATSPRESKPRELKSRELRPQAPAPQEPLLNSATIQSPNLAPELAGSVAAAKEATKPVSREAPRVEGVKADAPRPIGKIATMSPSRDDPCDDSYDDSFEGSWSGETEEGEPDQDVQASSSSSKRRLTALAALIVLAVVSGAVGAVATLRVGHRLAQSSDGSDQTRTASVDNQAIEESIARIEANLASLKQLNTAESAKINDRIDKVEKVQAEPAAKLAQLSETVERLRAAPAAFAAMPKETVKETTKETSAATPPAAAPAAVASIAAPKEITGSIQPPPVAAPKPRPKLEAKPDPKPEAAARLPTLEGWVLRDVTNDGAVIEGRQGLFEVLAGDAMPGLGRIEAIKRQDGRWVVVTTKGLIVAR